MKEYLDPTDWSLKLVNVDNDAAQPDWVAIPEGAELLAELPFADPITGINKAFYKENFKYVYAPGLFRRWVETRPPRKFFETYPVLWRRQKPRVRVYATLSQSKFKRAVQRVKESLIEERLALSELRVILDRNITEAAPGWREAARKRVLEEWQPDWSFAPEGYNWWAMDENRKAFWYRLTQGPSIYHRGNYWNYHENGGGIIPAPTFGYQGDWRDSLRKRPTTEWQPDWTLASKGCDWFAVDSDGTGTFMNYEPEMLCGTWIAPSSTTHLIIKARPGTNFGYKGDWRDSLRKCKKIGGVIIL